MAKQTIEFVQSAAIGAVTDAAVVTDANGTVIAFLRGLVKLFVAKINVKVADGDNTTEGTTTGTAIVSDVDGTLQRYLRGLVKIFADAWDSTNHLFRVSLPAATVSTLTPPGAITGFALESAGNLAAVKTNTDAIGAVTDAAVVTDANGTVIAFLRGLVKIFADAWDSTNHLFRVSLPAATVSTLTPPAAITGFALESAGNLAAVKTNTDRELGKNGGIIIADTNPHATLSCFAIKALGGDVVVAAMTLASGWTGSMTALTISDGDTLVIGFTAVTLTSGTAIVYNN